MFVARLGYSVKRGSGLFHSSFPCAVQYTGYVKWYNEARGYGFITSESTKQDYFVHVKSVKGYSPETFIDLKPHTRVKFKIEAKRPGKQSEAIDVEVMKE